MVDQNEHLLYQTILVDCYPPMLSIFLLILELDMSVFITKNVGKEEKSQKMSVTLSRASVSYGIWKLRVFTSCYPPKEKVILIMLMVEYLDLW